MSATAADCLVNPGPIAMTQGDVRLIAQPHVIDRSLDECLASVARVREKVGCGRW